MDAGARKAAGHGRKSPRRRGRPPGESGDDTRAAILAAAERLFGAGWLPGAVAAQPSSGASGAMSPATGRETSMPSNVTDPPSCGCA